MSTPRLVCYRATDGYRCHLLVGARITAESGEAYSRRDSLRRAIDRLPQAFSAFDVRWATGGPFRARRKPRPVRTRRLLDRAKDRRRG